MKTNRIYKKISLETLICAATHTGPVKIVDWTNYESKKETADYEYENTTKAVISIIGNDMGAWEVDMFCFLESFNLLVIDCNMKSGKAI